MTIRRALISVSDKKGIAPFAAALAEAGVTLISTGGTAKTLRAAGLDVVDISTVTGFPEIMDGRVKTLHPSVHGGLLGRTGADDDVMSKHGIYDTHQPDCFPYVHFSDVDVEALELKDE